MLQAYTQAAATLNLLRAFSTGGYRRHPPRAFLDAGLHRRDTPRPRTLPRLANRISDTLDFMAAAA
jgi:3-deoxy-D-arabino-heptulosonate 7-phosphate (DAHP) synthase class II